ncbi:MAG: aldehyde ferredoxin oxidoreductase family protein [Gemmataceae bacterium]|nr:aldehyde ferredoxin oxidoreductase family protein [Gemmataceae bacterium]
MRNEAEDLAPIPHSAFRTPHSPPFGYHGQYLRIDVTTGDVRAVPLPEDVLRQYVGGVGLAARLLHRECPPGVDPLAPDNPLAFVFSPLVGTPLTTSAKFAVAAKSPLTGRFNDALSSSHFALSGKKTGSDALVIVGRAAAPSILLIDDGAVRLEPAGHLWGRTTPDATAGLRDRHGPDWSFAVIGPAGERLVRFATISHDNRHAGRGGLGAVLGSKNLKAVGVRGTRRTPVADPAGVVAAARDLSARSFGPAAAKYRELGTVANLLTFNRLNALPTRNFQAGQFEGAEAVSGEALSDAARVARRSCAACTIGCEHIYRVGDRGEGLGDRTEPPATNGLYPNPSPLSPTVRLEYESLFALGPLCGISDRGVILRAARLCDDLGMDTISAGATAAFAMECSERGLLEDTGPPPEETPPPNPLPYEGRGDQTGRPGASPPPPPGGGGRGEGSLPHFGDGDALLSLLGMIGRREGPGDLLADGTRRAAAAIGGGAADFAPHVKGLELPGYEPRALQAMALGFAVGTRGADHNRSGAYEVDFSPDADRRHGDAESARRAVETEDRAALIDSLILCKFLRGVFPDLWAESADLLAKVTGWDVTADELRATARRVIDAKKRFNIREGWTPAEDTLPRRFLGERLPDGSAPGAVLPEDRLRAMIRAYNRARGWTEDGWVGSEETPPPTPSPTRGPVGEPGA